MAASGESGMEQLLEMFTALEVRLTTSEMETETLRKENAELRHAQSTRQYSSVAGGAVGTRLMNKPDVFHGRDGD